MRQRHLALDAGFGELERGHLILRGRFRQRLPEREDARGGDQYLQQKILDEAGGLQSPALAAGQFRLRVDVAVVHSRNKPCWTASNTASPRVWTSSLR